SVIWMSGDSELGHIDIEEFWVRTQKVTRSPWMDKLIGSALHFAGGIPVSAVNNKVHDDCCTILQQRHEMCREQQRR
ncbi:hypothetical protein KI387_041864, partial [Taxus chinensis]